MARYFFASRALLLTIYTNSIHARSWRNIRLLYDINTADNFGNIYLAFIENILLNESWSGVTNRPPIVASSNRSDVTFAPSPSPSNGPTNVPTVLPSSIPTSAPSYQPSHPPSNLPSSSPTLDPYPRISGPNEGERGFFNYDPSTTSKFGPSMWGNVRLPRSFYWDEFTNNGFGPWKGTLGDVDFDKNLCERGMKHQSPIDVYETVSGCNETHEIREHNGDFSLRDVKVEKRIESNKLRLIFPRRPCADVNKTKCQFPHPPWADFPNGFPGIADVMHIDLKITSEHWLRGESFDGEIQIFHLHAKNGRAVAPSTLIRATEQGHNHHFQLALDAFQEEYDKNQAACNKTRNTHSNGTSVTAFASNATIGTAILTDDTHTTTSNHLAYSGHTTDETIWTNTTHWTTHQSIDVDEHKGVGNKAHNRRDLHNIPDAWSPYHPDIIPTIYYYRYEGSITEPPCNEFVTWFINDIPTNISLVQLEQWRAIQFTNVDAQTCTSTSVHSDRSVARPIKRPPPPDLVVSRCTMADFGPDLVRPSDF